MGKHFELLVRSDGIRLDKYVSGECTELSRSYVQKLIADGYIAVNGEAADGSRKVKAGDTISVNIPEPLPAVPKPENIPLDVVYEDKDVVVVNKPAGLTVHPAPGQMEHTLVNAILNRYPHLSIGGSTRPGIVHRLDKDTSGLMVIAKNDAAHRNLSNQMKSREVVKRYKVLVHGRIAPAKGIIEAPIGRDPGNRKRMAVVDGGREARTIYRVEQYFEHYSLLDVTLETGRTHQIRVHLSAIGFPVVGDRTYGMPPSIASRQFLHAYYLGFKLPSRDEFVDFSIALPADLVVVLEKM